MNKFQIFSIHICVTLLHTKQGLADKFIDDVTVEVATLMKDPTKPVEGKVIRKLCLISFVFSLIELISMFLMVPDGFVWRSSKYS